MMTPDEAAIEIAEAFISNMTVEQLDPWEFFDWTRNTWGFQQVVALHARLRDVMLQEKPAPQRIEDAVRITKAVFGTTGVPFNESAIGLGDAAAEVFRSALRSLAER
jgi:hypothetical protein